MKQRTKIPPLVEQSELIDRLGGPAKLAAALTKRTGEKITQQAVSNWRVRGIAFSWRAIVTKEANERGIGVPPNFFGEQAPPPAPPEPPNEVPFL